MKRVGALCVLLSLLFACRKDPVNGTPQPPDDTPEWTVFNITNSPIPDNQVNALAIDKNDTKWIGTSKGLIRFQENKWTIFDPSNSPLPSSYVQSLVVENNGTVWAGTSQGLARFSNGNWQIFTTANSQLTHQGILSLAHDGQRRITYVGTEGSTISIDQQNNWEIIEDTGNPVLSMAVDKNGVLWSGNFNFIAFMGRIRKFDHGQFYSFNLADRGYPSSFPYAIAIDSHNQPVVTLTGTSVRAVVRINGNNLEEIPYSAAASGFKAVSAEGDKVWLAGNSLSVLGDKNHPSLKIPGTDSPIQTISIDSKGDKWLGTYYGGLVRYHNKP